MLYTFTKIEDNCYYAFNKPLSSGLTLKNANIKLEELLFKTFKSIERNPHISMCYYFTDTADEAYFLLLSAQGIEI